MTLTRLCFVLFALAPCDFFILINGSEASASALAPGSIDRVTKLLGSYLKAERFCKRLGIIDPLKKEAVFAAYRKDINVYRKFIETISQEKRGPSVFWSNDLLQRHKKMELTDHIRFSYMHAENLKTLNLFAVYHLILKTVLKLIVMELCLNKVLETSDENEAASFLSHSLGLNNMAKDILRDDKTLKDFLAYIKHNFSSLKRVDYDSKFSNSTSDYSETSASDGIVPVKRNTVVYGPTSASIGQEASASDGIGPVERDTVIHYPVEKNTIVADLESPKNKRIDNPCRFSSKRHSSESTETIFAPLLKYLKENGNDIENAIEQVVNRLYKDLNLQFSYMIEYFNLVKTYGSFTAKDIDDFIDNLRKNLNEEDHKLDKRELQDVLSFLPPKSLAFEIYKNNAFNKKSIEHVLLKRNYAKLEAASFITKSGDKLIKQKKLTVKDVNTVKKILSLACRHFKPEMIEAKRSQMSNIINLISSFFEQFFHRSQNTEILEPRESSEICIMIAELVKIVKAYISSNQWRHAFEKANLSEKEIAAIYQPNMPMNKAKFTEIYNTVADDLHLQELDCEIRIH